MLHYKFYKTPLYVRVYNTVRLVYILNKNENATLQLSIFGQKVFTKA